MRTLFAKILLWFVATSLVSLAAFEVTSALFLPQHGPTGFFARTRELQLEDARIAFEGGGGPRLAAYLRRLDSHYGSLHVLTDNADRDLVDGEDRSPLLARVSTHAWPLLHNFSTHVLASTSDDHRYRLIVVIPPTRRVPSFLPFYFWILLGTTILCYILAINLARPLRRLRRTMERFGQGDLGARAGSTRRDEIGDLSRAFDRMAERIETLLTAERRLLQDVSHELRSPLARLRFAVELARIDNDREGALAHIRQDVERLANLVDELLQLTRAEGDPSSRTLDEIPLHDLLRSLVKDCTLESEARGCGLSLRIDHPVFVRGERELLRRAVENVLRNAIRYAPEGTGVEVGLDLGPALATITVRDYGPGIPEEALGDVFKPFYRVADDRDRASGGVGLGLSIAQRAISLHRGAIRARNANPGLIVTIELPHSPERPEEEP